MIRSVAAPRRPRGFDVVHLLHLEDLCAQHASDREPAEQAEDEDHRPFAPPDDRDDRERREDVGERKEDVGDAHDERVDGTTEVAGHRARGNTDQDRDQHGEDPDPQRDAGAEDDTGEDVAADLIGPEPVLCTERLSPVGDVDRCGIEPADELGEDRQDRR